MNRRTAPLIPLAFLLVAVAYLATAVTHLVASGVAYRDALGPATRPAGLSLGAIQAEQVHWGLHTMVAVAAVALCVVTTLVTWVVTGPNRENRP